MRYQVRAGVLVPFVQKYYKLLILAIAGLFTLSYMVMTLTVSATTNYTYVGFSGSELLNWSKDREWPSGGYESLANFGGRSDVLEMRVDTSSANSNSWYWHEGLKRSLPDGTTSVQADLFLDSNWENKDVAAGIWGVGDDGLGNISAYPIFQFTTAGSGSHVGWRVFDDMNGGYINLSDAFSWDSWHNIEIILNNNTTLFDIKLDGNVIASSFYPGSAELSAVILNNYNYATSNPDDNYMVHWSDFTYGQHERSAQITSPAQNAVVSGSVDFAAYLDDDDADDIQWAIRQGTCEAGTNTVFGNVDGFSDVANIDQSDLSMQTFEFTADMSALVDGMYCFIYNPVEDSGESNIRLTREFTLFNLDTKEECKNEGWMQGLPGGETFRNQGDCVSYFATVKSSVGQNPPVNNATNDSANKTRKNR